MYVESLISLVLCSTGGVSGCEVRCNKGIPGPVKQPRLETGVLGQGKRREGLNRRPCEGVRGGVQMLP